MNAVNNCDFFPMEQFKGIFHRLSHKATLKIEHGVVKNERAGSGSVKRLSLTKIVLSNSPVNDLSFIDTIRTFASLSPTPQSQTHRQIGRRVTATKSSRALDRGGKKKW